jgi:glycosyl transferase family 25
VYAYVVNLARSPDRRAHIANELAKTGIDYEFVDAVDGRELNIGDVALVDRVAARDGSLGDTAAAVAGGVGCVLSHQRVYQKVVADGHDRALVLEDDMVLPTDLGTLADAVGEGMAGAEVVLLKFTDERGTCRVAKQGTVALPAARQLVRPVGTRLCCTGAYVVTAEACRRMDRATLPVRVKADAWGYYCSQGTLDSVRCVVPMPVDDSPTFRSTIDFFDPHSRQARVREWVARVKVPGLYQVLALRRRYVTKRRALPGAFEFVEAQRER